MVKAGDILGGIAKNPSIIALAALGIGLFIFRDKISDFFSAITGGAAAASQAGEITQTALDTLQGNQQGLLDALNNLTTGFNNFFNQPPPESFTPPVPNDQVIVAPLDLSNCECGGHIESQFGITFGVCDQCQAQDNQLPSQDPTQNIPDICTEIPQISGGSFNSCTGVFTPPTQVAGFTPPPPTNQGVQSGIPDQQFQGGGVSFIGGSVNPTPIANLTVSQIVDQFMVTASQAVNILAQAQDNFGNFDFGTNTGSGIGSVTTDPIFNTQLPNQNSNVSDPQFAGLTPTQIAQLLTGGNISNF